MNESLLIKLEADVSGLIERIDCIEKLIKEVKDYKVSVTGVVSAKDILLAGERAKNSIVI